MGCCASRSQLETVDDSVHVMLQHDKKLAQRKGEKPQGYVPRAPHPLLQPKSVEITATEKDGDNPENKSNKTEPSEEQNKEDKPLDEQTGAQPSSE